MGRFIATSFNDELNLDAESIIFEIVPEGWHARKLTQLGWFSATALTIREATAALRAQIRSAAGPNASRT